jgi:hypothetical protein
LASLRELQRSFAAALRDPAVACAVLPPANLSVYRNNSSHTFRTALEQTFPVLRRRVGDDYFRQLAVHYREKFPARSGDLHWTGRDFAAFLDEYLRDGDYAWLADLARLEWARNECAVAAESPAVGPDVLARFGPADFEHLVFGFQPALRLLDSSYPVFSVWLTNQAQNAPPVDQSLGSESGMVRLRHEYPEVSPLDPRLFSFICALFRGASLGDAMTRANLDEGGLTEALAFIFNEGLVCSVALRTS